MGRDKALLPYRGTLLIKHIAGVVEAACGEASLIGEPERYRGLGYPVYADEIDGCGPLGGVYTALCVSQREWNLIVACDMPGISPELLRALLDRADGSSEMAVLASGPDRHPEPLCGVYHRDCLPVVLAAIRDKRLKMMDLAKELQAGTVPVDTAALLNLNTPSEWAASEQRAL